MDTAEVTLRLDRPIAERLRTDATERARYEAFLGLVATAETPAEIEQAVHLFTAPAAERQRMLAGAFEEIGQAAARAGAAAEEVEAELAMWKRERSAQ
ncbi:hypothetical protein [Paracraurococcus lichenis]|uniref:Uncharacterized protein n=1 Tax=Paracraurococcus lichenis TaxID=3064888 RepID=A0ABT9EAC1_9PROT|nr:hypothetical protein [Paracraurococcus sp. LOR1-02]MDO9713154.1 hypothetical protein [Paracraurococcus sp. LOR1-02]